MLFLLALSTLLAEDLTCIAAGVLVATGQLGFVEATAACLAGIVAGDLGLFAAGRLAGRRLLALPWLRRLVTDEQLERAGEWLSQRGAVVVFASRFTPGMRLPMYLAAGALRTDAVRFAVYFTVASAIWTPLLIGASALLGEQGAHEGYSRLSVGAAGLGFVLLGPRLLTWERRRRVVGFVRAKVRWEFWPVWAAYLPVVPWIALLALRHRSLTLFTSANPGMEAGGFAGESKSQILSALAASGAVAPVRLVRPGEPPALPERWPVVLKPDVGERGDGVVIAKSVWEYETYLRTASGMTIVQEYVTGLEFGILYCRRPGEAAGRILSITEKRFPEVTGDGRRTMKQLILGDSRAVCLANVYLRRNARRIDTTPADGERVQLVDIGSHCKGAVFVNAMHLCTEALSARVDAVSTTHPEFYLGRYDVRTPSAGHLQAGDFTVLELNGVTGEPIHIYDPAVSLWDAYRALYRHWQLAFEIGAANRRRGFAPVPLIELWRTVRTHLKRSV